MATTTPNFGWTVPTSTDLVKDGATAIETLGDGIDASFVGLKGGTTGQVLSKTSGTDLAFTWVAQDDSNAIQNAIVDAKGDLIAATANDTPARLAVGTNGQVLVADSTAATGLKWAAAPSGKIIQVVQSTYATETSSTSLSYADTGLSATITPTLSTSTILVAISQQGCQKDSGDAANGLFLRLLRGGTTLLTYGNLFLYNASTTQTSGIWSLQYIDSPATTSATTYKTQLAARNTGSGSAVKVQQGSVTSTMILMEIGA